MDVIPGRPLAPDVWYCPGCEDELTQDATAMWCGTCQAIVPYALIRDHPENDEDF